MSFQGTDLYIGPGALQYPLLPNADNKVVNRRAMEWLEHRVRWRWLLDSYEGGQRYRNAIYGYDTRGLPIYNLVRHKREYPDTRETPPPMGYPPANVPPLGTDPNRQATDDDFQMRRARTPVPTFVREAVDEHLGKIYAREVTRTGPAELTGWWADVDGAGTTIDEWMQNTLAPMLMTLGNLDVLLDHPAAEDGAVVSEADRKQLGLQRCVARFILPENVLWWRLDATGRYEEVLIFETGEDAGGRPVVKYRLWTKSGWVLFDANGEQEEEGTHAFGRVPVIRLFDRKKTRCVNTGQSRYESVAERQREFYNRDSELILSDTTQAHPLLQGPEDYVQADGTIPIGPAWLLPKKKTTTGVSASYEGFDVIEFPKEGANSLRQNKHDLRDEVDRDVKLTKPAGQSAITRGNVEQSGISKNLDQQAAHDMLSQVAQALRRAEAALAELALAVLRDGGPAGPDEYQVVYPTSFDLFSASDVAVASSDFQLLVDRSGNLPEAEAALLKRLYRLVYPGQGDAFYAGIDGEIEAFMRAGGGIAAKTRLMQEQMAAQAIIRAEASAVAQNEVLEEEGVPSQPANRVRNAVHDPTSRLQPPGQGGRPTVA